MYYETKISYLQDGNGKLKKASLTTIIDCDLHAEAEAASYEKFSYLTDNDVVSVKRSKIIEIVNDKGDIQTSFVLTLCSTFVDDNGKETKTKYRVLLWAKDIVQAEKIAHEYVEQGLTDLEIIKLEKSSITELI